MDTHDSLVAYLDELDIDAATLRVDPSGRSWLPPNFQRALDTDRDAQRIVAAFVAVQRELFSSSAAAADPLFTARVVNALPRERSSNLERRTWILASFHALACGVAYLLIRPLLGTQSLPQALSTVHGLLDVATDTGLLWGVVAAVALAAWVLASSSSDRVGVALPRS